MTEQDAKNLKALRDGILTIRGLAWSKKNSQETPEELLEKIGEIANHLHNVPQFIAEGVDCNATYLLKNGTDKNWPTRVPQKS